MALPSDEGVSRRNVRGLSGVAASLSFSSEILSLLSVIIGGNCHRQQEGIIGGIHARSRTCPNGRFHPIHPSASVSQTSGRAEQKLGVFHLPSNWYSAARKRSHNGFPPLSFLFLLRSCYSNFHFNSLTGFHSAPPSRHPRG